jgi:hypothetical protein
MSVHRTEYVMMGVFIKELPFDKWDDKYEMYVCGASNASIWVVALSDCSDEGHVIGKVLSMGDSYEGVELMSIDDDLVQLKKDIPAIIKEELDMDVSVEDVKLYTFSSWS